MQLDTTTLEAPSTPVKQPVLVKYPSLRIQQTLVHFDSFVDNYNKDKELPDRLRGMHKAFFYKLINCVKIELDVFVRKYSKDYKLDIAEPFTLQLNRPYMSALIMMSGATVKRYLNRMQDAGILTQDCNGRYANSEVKISPEFLIFCEKLSIAENQSVSLKNDTSCPPSCVQEPSNKRIMDVENPPGLIKHGTKQGATQDLTGSTQNPPQDHRNASELSGTSSTKKEKVSSGGGESREQKIERAQRQKEQSFAKRRDKDVAAAKNKALRIPKPIVKIDETNKLESFKLSTTSLVFSYALHKIYTKQTIYDMEMVRAQAMLWEQIFSKAQTFQQLAALEYEYMWRIDYVANFISVKRGQWQAAPPSYFFNTKNYGKGSFEYTASKWLKHKSTRIEQQQKKQQRKNRETLKKCLAAIANDRSRDQLVKQRDYLRKYHPSLVPWFERHVENGKFMEFAPLN